MERNAYRVCAEISLDALEHNISCIRSAAAGAKLMCVIKANAYGHGAVVLARQLLQMGADAFAVAALEEGIELRRNGIKCPILVLGYTSPFLYREMIEYDIMPAVFTYDMAREIDAAARELGKVCPIHIKIDTGMSRIGFAVSEEAVKNIVMISGLCRNLKIEGIFTHFSCADCKDDELTQQQADRFRWMLDQLEQKDIHIPCVHCANSAAIMRYPQLKMNMVRAGIILYGLYPSEEIDKSLMELEPVMQLKSRVSYIKTVEAGTTVSYGATFVCSRKTKIATVSAGYADGYPRAASNRGRVLIREQSFPIIGRVCMDQLMVDITDARNDIHQGDEVVLVGGQGQ